MGSRKYTDYERQNEDFYATDPKALELFPLFHELTNVWECAVGQGHLANVLHEHNKLSRVSDLVDRGYPNTEILDFLNYNGTWAGDILTNPPFKLSSEFLRKGLEIIQPQYKLCLFLPVRYVEGKSRRKIFNIAPPKTIYVSSGRITCAKDGDFETYKTAAISYAWFVWEKGYKGNTTLKWFN
jgi:hypothetical protein